MKLLAAAVIAIVSARGADLLVAAASDFAPLSAAVQKNFGNLKFSFASSGSLAQQIENGAPFDVFLSANDQYVKQLAASGKVDPPSVVVYALGRIALWSPNGSVRDLHDLTKAAVKHLAIPNPEHAPYGVAARQALEKSSLWKEIEPKIVYGENVRQALQFAETGNVDAVITSWTLLAGRGTLLPADLHAPIRQTGAIVKSSANAAAARRFLNFLTGPEGRKVLQDGGLFRPD